MEVQYYPCKEKALLFSGVKAKSILQKLITTDLNLINEEGGQSCAFLKESGSLITLAKIYLWQKQYLLSFSEQSYPDLKQHLASYGNEEIIIENSALERKILFQKHDSCLSFKNQDYLATTWDTFDSLENLNLTPLTKEEYQLLRIEALLPEMYIDIFPKDLLHEFHLDLNFISPQKRAYLGHECMTRLNSDPLMKRQLFRLQIFNLDKNIDDLELFLGNKKCGRLSTISYCPKRRIHLGMGLLDLKALKRVDDIVAEFYPKLRFKLWSVF